MKENVYAITRQVGRGGRVTYRIEDAKGKEYASYDVPEGKIDETEAHILFQLKKMIRRL